MNKQCRQCLQVKDESEFYPKRAICKTCKSSNDCKHKSALWVKDSGARKKHNDASRL